ncbi:MAG: glycosyltransferase family 2 protein [Planctomycetaceae bacterium]|nr:glycosyltransferase family 2 protein [Planctomycetaceae bacterium]
MNVSLVIPIYNELENIDPLQAEIRAVMQRTNQSYEVIYVDDGSTDGSQDRLIEIANMDPDVRVVRFRRNYGQTAAMQAGMESASGDVIVTLDGDLQNDPRDIPAMLDKIDDGFDLIHGWRKNRQDAWLSRKLPSKLANALISWSTGQQIHDLGCTLKAIRREIADELELYGQMHRFIPILAAERGARCLEMVTNHRARKYGKSKYGISRTLQVLLDLCTVRYMQDYFSNPMKLFGRFAAGCMLLGSVALAAVVGMKFFQQVDMTGNPLLLMGVFLWLASVQLISLGLLGEVSARIYYNRQGNRPFAIARKIGFQARLRKAA